MSLFFILASAKVDEATRWLVMSGIAVLVIVCLVWSLLGKSKPCRYETEKFGHDKK